jgi:hypothetical protein
MLLNMMLKIWSFRLEIPKRTEAFFEESSVILLHNKELYALYSSPNIIRVIKSRRLRWAGHVARMGERRGAYRALVGKPE